jgi:hypothetical protein
MGGIVNIVTGVPTERSDSLEASDGEQDSIASHQDRGSPIPT